MEHDGISLAFDIYSGNKSEQPTLKPLEKKILKEYRLHRIVVCTDAGLSSKTNRKSNDLKIGGEHVRSFITTQSIKKLPAYLKEFALDPSDWHLIGSEETYCLDELVEKECYNKIFYKERWIK